MDKLKELKAKIEALDAERSKLYKEFKELERQNSAYYILYDTSWEETAVIRLGYMNGAEAEKVASKYKSFSLQDVSKEINDILYEIEIVQKAQTAIEKLSRIHLNINTNLNLTDVTLEDVFYVKVDRLSKLICEEGISLSSDNITFKELK